MDREPPAEQPGSVVASVDRGDEYTRLVVSDVSADGRWVAIRYAQALPLDEWR